MNAITFQYVQHVCMCESHAQRWEDVSVGKVLGTWHEDLNSDTQRSHKKPDIAVCDCNPTAVEVEQACPRGLLSSQPSRMNEPQVH